MWINHSLSTVLDIRHDFPIQKIDRNIFNEIRNIKKFSSNIPFLKTHNCIQCKDEKSEVSSLFFDKVQLFYMLGERDNLFHLRNQICKKSE